jgi:hypothetical protein
MKNTQQSLWPKQKHVDTPSDGHPNARIMHWEKDYDTNDLFLKKCKISTQKYKFSESVVKHNWSSNNCYFSTAFSILDTSNWNNSKSGSSLTRYNPRINSICHNRSTNLLRSQWPTDPPCSWQKKSLDWISSMPIQWKSRTRSWCIWQSDLSVINSFQNLLQSH